MTKIFNKTTNQFIYEATDNVVLLIASDGITKTVVKVNTSEQGVVSTETIYVGTDDLQLTRPGVDSIKIWDNPNGAPAELTVSEGKLYFNGIEVQMVTT